MVEIYGKYYYIDLDSVTERCRTTTNSIDEEDSEDNVTEINIFKYEILKMCVDRALNEFDEVDDEGGGFGGIDDTTVSFKIAFNTLIKNNILLEDYE